ncbi:MAG: hypothetical protein EP329_12425 [Deltaproteobacteria bacterium]|nr:MAG: hypothetical protein EP329_12425 [Deltaproteobacteria bacterium]
MRIQSPVSVLLASLLVVAACGDTVKYVDCPLGTLPQGSQCVPIGDDTVQAADTLFPNDTVTPVDTAAEDTAQDTATAPDTEPADTADTVAAPGGVGAACLKNADCEGGTCLDWRGGYCTALGCDSGGCPDGSTCVAAAGGNHVCLLDCAGDEDCRAGGEQACKTLRDGNDGPLNALCVGVDADAASVGSPCGDATDCAGAAACLASFPGGYCGVIGCTPGSCPAGSVCVDVDGDPTCLRSCTSDASCGGTAGAERRCGILEPVGGGTAGVCISGAAVGPVGAPCLSDFECESGTCQILGDGACGQTGGPCFVASVATDCNGAESCLLSADSRTGICTRPCGPGSASCPDGSFCVSDGTDSIAGACRPVCSFGGHECDAVDGLACRFGIPLSEGAQGRYVCRRERPRGFGSACVSSGDCHSGSCLKPAGGGAGLCVEACVGDGYCPFPGSCVYGDDPTCYPACFSASDCPSGFSCAAPSGSPRNVCTPD